MKTKRPIETASRYSLQHLLHLRPGRSFRVNQDMCTISPIQEPIFQAVNFFMFVNVSPELIRWTTPAELPAPVAFYLIIKCIRLYIIKAKRIIFRILQVLLPFFPFFCYPVGAGGLSLQYCYSLCHVIPFFNGGVCKTSKRIRYPHYIYSYNLL